MTGAKRAVGVAHSSDIAARIGSNTWPAFALICLAAILPLLAVDLPPLVDLPGHLGRYAIQTDLPNRPELRPYFSFEWKLIGNLGADILVETLHGWLGLEGAVRVIVIVTQLLAASAILQTSREIHGRITPFAIAALPLIYGYPFNFGFLNFSLGMALGLWAFVLWLRLRRAGRPVVSRIWLALAGGVIWLCHTYGWAFLGLLCGSAMLAAVIAAKARPFSAVRRILTECWPLLLPLIAMIAWRAETAGTFTGGWSPVFKLVWLITPLRTYSIALDIGSVLFLAGLICWAIRDRSASFDRRLSIAALLCFAFVLILPMRVFGSAFADMRLMPYALIIALLAITPRNIGPQALRILSLVAFAFFAGRMVTTSTAYIVQERAVAAELASISAIPKGSRVAFFAVSPCRNRWALPVLNHLGGLALARRSIFVNDQWQEPGVNPLTVHYKAAAPFEHDPSHLVGADGCGNGRPDTLSWALKRLPQRAFTHVWIVGAVPDQLPVLAGLEPVAHAGQSALYAVTPTR